MLEGFVTTRVGETRKLKCQVGVTLMEAIRDTLDEMAALCGGSCVCGTCHVYVDPAFLAALPTMNATEIDLISGSAHYQSNSRLACQLPFSEASNGIRLTIAPED